MFRFFPGGGGGFASLHAFSAQQLAVKPMSWVIVADVISFLLMQNLEGGQSSPFFLLVCHPAICQMQLHPSKCLVVQKSECFFLVSQHGIPKAVPWTQPPWTGSHVSLTLAF